MTTQPAHGWVPEDNLATRLVLVRRQLGLTQRQAAERTGLTFGEWQSMEDGRQARGIDQKVARISLALGVDRDWLMWGPVNKPYRPHPFRRGLFQPVPMAA
jgi:transcriptional regulator with XRE-family HTH domain